MCIHSSGFNSLEKVSDKSQIGSFPPQKGKLTKLRILDLQLNFPLNWAIYLIVWEGGKGEGP